MGVPPNWAWTWITWYYDVCNSQRIITIQETYIWSYIWEWTISAQNSRGFSRYFGWHNRETHDRALNATMRTLRDKGLTVNLEKCLFGMTRLEFMGLLLSEKGIGPTEARVQAILDTRAPQTVAELRSFLGLATYSSRFIPRFSTMTELLRRLLKTGAKFEFGKDQNKAFDNIKSAMGEATTLAYFDKNGHTKIIAHASPVGLGAVLVQEQNGENVPISYASRTLTDTEQKYSQTEREALALVWACERFHMYVYGQEFDLITDHNPLQAIYGPRSKPSAWIER